MLVYSNFSLLPFRTGRISSSARNAPTDFNLRFGASGKPQNGAQNSAAARRQKTENSNPDCLSQSFCTARTNRRKRNFPLSRLKSNHSQAFAAPQNVCLRPEELRKDELVFPKAGCPPMKPSRAGRKILAAPPGSAHFQRNAPMRNFTLKNAQTTRRKGDAAAFIAGFAKRPVLRRPNAPKKRPLSPFPKAGATGGKAGFAPPPKVSIPQYVPVEQQIFQLPLRNPHGLPGETRNEVFVSPFVEAQK